jgi:CheY-like chemotaxis protein/HPt (histidine-containing phosphotransfer) domain-containing protein
VAQAEAEGTLVLLVDDHPVNRMLLLRQVRTLGYAAQTADDGAQALKMWQAGRYGLVITDCHMPHMDGYELARAIRSEEAASGTGNRIPIVACTANALQGEAEACLAAGMDDFLVKPVELSQLVQKLDQWLPIPADSAPGGIDHALLMTNCGGDAGMVAEVLAAFRRTCEEDSVGLRQAVAAGNAGDVTRFAHRMAGAARMVGANDFANACAEIDRAGRAGDWAAIAAGMAGFERERGRVA